MATQWTVRWPTARGRRRGVRWLTAIAAGCFLAGAGVARADDPAAGGLAVGTAYETSVELWGKQIPLPAGDWVLAGQGHEQVPGFEDLAYGAIESVVLFKIDDKAVSAFIIAHRNVIPIEGGWGSARECARSDIPASLTYDAEEGHTFCGFIAAVDTHRPAGSAASWTDAVAFAREHDLILPEQWRMAGFRLSDRSDVVDVRYHFDPALRRAERPPASGAVTLVTAAAAADPPSGDDEAFGLEPWLEAMQGAVKVGFDNGLADLPAVAMPWTTAELESPFTDLRLRQLDEIKAAKLISDDDYATQREEFLKAEVKLAPEQMSNEELTGWKLLADQASSATLFLTANYLVLVNVPQSVGLLALQMGTDVIQYTVHEYSWNTLGPSRLREAPEIDFAQAGVILPNL
jgi:hypothetical protein